MVLTKLVLLSVISLVGIKSYGFSHDAYYKKIMKIEKLSAKKLKTESEGEIAVLVGENITAKKPQKPEYKVIIYTAKHGSIELRPNSESALANLQSGSRVSLKKTRDSIKSFKLSLNTKNPLARSVENFEIHTIVKTSIASHKTADHSKRSKETDKILFVRAKNFRTVPEYGTPHLSPSEFSARIFDTSRRWSLQSIFSRNSDNQVVFSGKIVDGIWGPTCIENDTDGLYKMVMDQVENQGTVDPKNFDRIVISLPQNSSCSSYNWGTIGKINRFFKFGSKAMSVSWIYEWYDGIGFGKVLAHEIGHNMYFQHANDLACSDQSIATLGCQKSEYADYSDIMGYSTYSDYQRFSMFRRYQAGWLAAPQVIKFNANESRVFELFDIKTNLPNLPQLGLIAISTIATYPLSSSKPTYLSLEYEATHVSDQYKGVVIRYANDYGVTARPVWSQTLRFPGDSFYDSANDITIQIIQTLSNSVEIRVTGGQAPEMPLFDIKPGHLAYGEGAGNCSSIIIDTNLNSPNQTVFLSENDTAGIKTAYPVFIATLPNGLRRYKLSYPYIDANKSYTAFIQTDERVYTKQIQPWPCNTPVQSLTIEDIDPTSCGYTDIILKTTNFPINKTVTISARSVKNGGLDAECDTLTNTSGEIRCSLFLDPNYRYYIEANVRLSSYDNIQSEGIYVGKKDCSDSARKDIRVIQGLKYKLVDSCHSVSIDIATTNVSAGTNFLFTATDKDYNEFSCTKVIGDSKNMRCVFEGLKPATQYYIKTSVDDEILVDSKDTDYCSP